MKVELENVKPMDIEKRSFEIITEELGDKKAGSRNRAGGKEMYSHKRRL